MEALTHLNQIVYFSSDACIEFLHFEKSRI